MFRHERRSRLRGQRYFLGGLILVAVALLIYTVALALGARPGHDQSWYLYAAKEMMSGVKLYGPRLSETNPPAILWFSTIPVLVARVSGIHPMLALRLLVTALACGSALWAIRIFRIQTARPRGFETLLMALAVAGCALGIETGDFAQREQLMVIFTLPYLFTAATGETRRLSLVESLLVGVLAGIGVCFKPQQALVIAGLEIFLLIYTRRVGRLVRPELLALIATGGLYLIMIRVFTPLYLREVVPQLLQTYWAFGKMSALDLAIQYQRTSTLVVLLVFAASFAMRASLRYPLLPMTLGVCSLAASIAFDLQHTGWDYQAFPAKAFLFLAFVLLALDVLYPIVETWARNPRPVVVFGLAAATLVMVWFGGTTVHGRSVQPVFPARASLAPLLTPYAPQTTIYVFSTALAGFADVYEHDLAWGSRFGHLWRLPAIVLNQPGPSNHTKSFKRLTPEALATLEEVQRRETAEDLIYWRPEAVMVERCTASHRCSFLEGREFDMIAWFSESPAFAAEWSHYQRQQGNDGFDVYTRLR